MAKWKEVSAYTGEAVEEDAPTNNAGSGAVSMPPDAMMKKKKKSLLDARTKAYKEHKAKLEAARQKRLESKKSKFVEKVKESIDDFNREVLSITVDTSLPSQRGVYRELETLAEWRGRPDTIRSDNNPKFTSEALSQWCKKWD